MGATSDEDASRRALTLTLSQRERAIPYSKDDFYGDLMRVTNGRAVPELADLLVDESWPDRRPQRRGGLATVGLEPGGRRRRRG